MHILFLQSERDALGGVINVNMSLSEGFLKKGHQVTFIHFRQRGQQVIKYPKQAKQILINDQDFWAVPRYSQAIKELKQLHPMKSMKTIIDRQNYDKKLNKDYQRCQRLISEEQPDIIICSHYECIQGIPEEYLGKTYQHYHNDFSQISSHKKQLELLKKYIGKVKSFLWLSEGIMMDAQKEGLIPSSYMWNPVQFETDKISEVVSHHKVIFIGRFCPEKRAGKAMELFLKASEGLDWTMDIYGIGELTEEEKKLIADHSKLNYKGATSNPKQAFLNSSLMIMTSVFEGLPLTIIEANECGVPVICYDYGASASDIVLSGITGEVIEMDDEVKYIETLRSYMMDEDKLLKASLESKKFAKNFHQDIIVDKWLDMMKGEQHEA